MANNREAINKGKAKAKDTEKGGTSRDADANGGIESTIDDPQEQTTVPSSYEDCPAIPDDAVFEEADYIALDIVTLLVIIQRLIFNFALDSEQALRDIYVALGFGSSTAGTRGDSAWNVFQRKYREEINEACKDISSLDVKLRSQTRSLRARALYNEYKDQAGGEGQYNKELLEWARKNPKSIKVGPAMKSSDLGKHVDKAAMAGIEAIRNVGKVADIAAVVFAWSTHVAADPRTTTVAAATDHDVEQSMSDLGWREPKSVAATFQTHGRLQHEKKYMAMIQGIVNKVTEALPGLSKDIATKPIPMNTTQQIAVVHAAKKRSKDRGETPVNAGDKTMPDVPIPKGYEMDNTVSVIKLLELGPREKLRSYFTAIFGDWLYIAHGHAPEIKLMKATNYSKEDVPKFFMKTIFRILFKRGFRIENWPYPVPFPSDQNGGGLASPQSWPSHLSKGFMQQFCHPEAARRVRLVCRRGDSSRIPFITRPDSKDGTSAEDSLDFDDGDDDDDGNGDSPGFPKNPLFPADRCYCAKHLGQNPFCNRYLQSPYPTAPTIPVVVTTPALSPTPGPSQPKKPKPRARIVSNRVIASSSSLSPSPKPKSNLSSISEESMPNSEELTQNPSKRALGDDDEEAEGSNDGPRELKRLRRAFDADADVDMTIQDSDAGIQDDVGDENVDQINCSKSMTATNRAMPPPDAPPEVFQFKVPAARPGLGNGEPSNRDKPVHPLVNRDVLPGPSSHPHGVRFQSTAPAGRKDSPDESNQLTAVDKGKTKAAVCNRPELPPPSQCSVNAETADVIEAYQQEDKQKPIRLQWTVALDMIIWSSRFTGKIQAKVKAGEPGHDDPEMLMSWLVGGMKKMIAAYQNDLAPTQAAWTSFDDILRDAKSLVIAMMEQPQRFTIDGSIMFLDLVSIMVNRPEFASIVPEEMREINEYITCVRETGLDEDSIGRIRSRLMRSAKHLVQRVPDSDDDVFNDGRLFTFTQYS